MAAAPFTRPFVRRSARAGVILGAALLAAVIVSQGSYPYDEDGHFYTAVTLQRAHQPPFNSGSRDQAVLLAFCAQLPDLVKEFDAMSLRVRLIPLLTGSLWGAFSFCWGDDVCRMVTVHHYLHGLTDSAAEPVTNAAVATLQSILRTAASKGGRPDPNAVCAAGFAVHLLADSFSHRRLDAPNRMYPPGLGHYHDDHNPDFILFNKDGKDRTQLWLDSTRRLSAALSLGVDKNAANAIVQDKLKGAKLENYFHEAEMLSALRDTPNGAAGDQPKIRAPYDPAVEMLAAGAAWWESHVLQRSCGDIFKKYTLPGGKDLDCDKIWKIYKDAAVAEFKKQRIPAVCRAV